MDSSTLLEFQPIEVGLNVFKIFRVTIGKDIVAACFSIGAAKITSYNLFQNVTDVDRL